MHCQTSFQPLRAYCAYDKVFLLPLQHSIEALKVISCCVQVVPGAFGFIAQFNEGRGSKKRPTEFCVDKVWCYVLAHPASLRNHRTARVEQGAI